MRIANPIYDAVFKYLLDDNDLAKLLLSTILGEEIVELTFSPQEHTTKLDQPRHFTVYRLDFAATIQNTAGDTRKVLIEVQKAKLATDIMRFRRYLGEQYRDDNNVIPTEDGYKQALPLLTIYFLGHGLDHSQAPVIHVKRESRDLATGEPLARQENFIESLTHDSYVIQIPHLRGHRRNAVEELLQIFNQEYVAHNQHFLEIDETVIQAPFRPFLRRLQRAIAEPEVEGAMIIEDDVLTELQILERAAETARAVAEQERLEKEAARAMAEQARATAEKAQAEAQKARAEVEKAQAEVEHAQAKAKQSQSENQRLLDLLRQAGIEP